MNSGASVTVVGRTFGNLRNAAFVYICTYKQHLEIISDSQSRERICEKNEPTECYSAELNGTIQSFSISDRDIYDFMIINCNRNRNNVYGTIELEVEISGKQILKL